MDSNEKSLSFFQYLKSRTVLIFILIVCGSTMTYFVCDSCAQSASWYAKVSVFTSSIWILMWLGNEYAAHWLDQKVSWTKEPIKRFVYGITAMLLYTVAMTTILVTIFEKGFDVDTGGIEDMIYASVITTSIITLFMTSRSFLLNWKQSAIDSERLQKENIKAQYDSLKSHVNPHFLFNSLNALTNLVYEDQDKAAKFIKQLSEVYRYVLDTQGKEVVLVEEELKFIESYLFLQKIRFGDNLRIDLDVKSLKSFVAPLALQLLLENAIKHNVVSVDDPLTIKISEHEQYLVVENKIKKKTTIGETTNGMGIENIKSRYTFLSTKPVEVKETDGKFIVKIPIIEAK
jgi:Histidine kinase